MRSILLQICECTILYSKSLDFSKGCGLWGIGKQLQSFAGLRSWTGFHLWVFHLSALEKIYSLRISPLSSRSALYQRRLIIASFILLNYTVIHTTCTSSEAKWLKKIKVSHISALVFTFVSANMNKNFSHSCHLICKSFIFHPKQCSSFDIVLSDKINFDNLLVERVWCLSYTALESTALDTGHNVAVFGEKI